MSDAAAKAMKERKYWISDSSPWANAAKISAALAGLGLVGVAFGALTDMDRLPYSYLFAFAVAMTLSLGCFFFVVVQHISAAHWGITVRRVAEFFVFAIPTLLVLFLPILFFFKGTLYEEWSHAGHDAGHAEVQLGTSVAQAQEHGHEGNGHAAEPGHDGGHAHSQQQQQLHHDTLGKKTWYLNDFFWYGRAAFYFLIWILLSRMYFGWSTKQDQTRDKKLTVLMQKFSPLAIILFGATLTFAAFDWFMSLEPSWYSTIYGVYVFAGSVIAAWATVTLISLSLVKQGHFGKAVNVEHFHDLGKLLFGFICFWTYIGFSQFMLIWYADIPEETTYFHRRWDDGGWATVSVILMLGHFVFPFFLLISRVPKRKLWGLQFGCLWMLLMHVVDMYWFVLPYANNGEFTVKFVDVSCLLAVVGVYLTVVFTVMRRYPLIPIGDPRLSRALEHVQTQ